MNSLKDHFLLDPHVVYLNHGSFGATPRPVFDVYQYWQRQLEREPVKFINNELPSLLRDARRALGRYINADVDDVVYVPNATFGVNIVAHALRLCPGDEVLTTDHEYGAMSNLWSYICQKRGATLVRQRVSFPIASQAELLEELWRGVTPRTKAIFVSHITSPTALCLPVAALCQRAREADVMTIIDGAHAPGQIDLDLDSVGADFYVGNCHKWLCSPKGAAFLYTRRSRQVSIEPLVVGWGWGENRKSFGESAYIDALEWLGTNDLSAYLAVPAAIEFQMRHDWPQRRTRCHKLLEKTLKRASDLTGLAPLYPEPGRHYGQMAVLPLPPIDDLDAFNRRLYDEYRIQIPCISWNGRQYLRVSVQAYNSEEDVEALLTALRIELAPHQRV
ncbi:MAG: aminotransferase class V-fold PLP-dependent enzyme [Gammaproteobacteria bacterium]|jgi:isopenicillin-N epimerase